MRQFILLIFARFAFGVHYYGSVPAMLVLILLGATMFSLPAPSNAPLK